MSKWLSAALLLPVLLVGCVVVDDVVFLGAPIITIGICASALANAIISHSKLNIFRFIILELIIIGVFPNTMTQEICISLI